MIISILGFFCQGGFCPGTIDVNVCSKIAWHSPGKIRGTQLRDTFMSYEHCVYLGSVCNVDKSSRIQLNAIFRPNNITLNIKQM
jgi:hypothetical protein